MYRTKKDVDKHVQDINSKIRNASDRNLKGYSIAKLYYQVGDYENARRYVSNYLSEKDTSTVAHKLLGQIYESLKQKDKAVAEYKKAYELDNTQKEIVLKICELLVDLPIDPQRARYWVEIGEKQHPHHDSVYRLREAMLTQVEGDTSPKLEEVLAAELVAKPTDVILRMRLVRLYQRSGRIQEGWDHVMQVEERMPWPENKDWYSCISELAENYQLQFRTKCGHQFYMEYISCLDRLVELEFRAGSAASGAAEVLHKLDQALHSAEKLPAAGQPRLWPALMAHFRGQLYLAAATLLFRRAQKEVSVWKENNKLAGALLLASWGIREIDCSREDGRRTQYWRGSGSSRRSQAGHILLGMAGKQGASVYQERLAGLATTNTQDKIYNAVFVSRDQRAGTATSCLASSQSFVDLVARTHLPSLSDLASTDEAMAALKTDDLHHLVWVGLRYYRPGKVLELGFRLPGIDGLSQEGGKDPLSQLDMDAFLYATVYVTGWQVEQEPAGEEAAPVLPVAISAPLATEAQEELWRVAIKSASEGLAPQERRVLQHGLDTIRAVGLHGLDLHLAMKLAKTFECHALEAKATADCDEHASRSVAILEARAATYYKCALSTIEKQDRGMGMRQPSVRLFSPAGGEPTTAEVTKMKEGAKFFLACQKMHQDLHEDALAAFGELRTPYASFYTAEIYKKLANEQLNNRPGQIQGDVSGRYGSLLREAQEALYRTLDRLKAPGEPAGHPLNQQLPECIEEVENLLAGVGVNGDEDVDKGATGTPRRVQGVTRLEEELTSTPNMARSLFGNQNSSYVNSPMRTEARPSPERLDAQVRNLATTQEGVMKTLMEQNTIFVESNKAILEELKSLNVEITKLRKSSESTAEKMSSLECATIAASDKAAEAIAAAAKAAEASAAALTASASAQPIAPSVAAATAAANMQQVQQAFHAHQQLNMHQAVNTMDNYTFTGEEQQLLDSFGYGNLGPQYGMYGQMSPFAQQMYTGAQMSQQQQLAAKAVAMRTAQQQQQQQQQQQVYSGMYSPQAWTGASMQQPQANLQLPTVPTSVTPSSFSQHLSVQQKNTLFAQMGSKPSQTGTPSNTPQEGTSLVATPLASGQVTPTQAASKPGLAKAVPAANVVITKSDKIPTTAAPTTVTMSVTIPPQHRLGTTPRPTPTTQLLTTPTLAQSPATPISAYKTPAGAGQLSISAGTPHGFQIPMPDGVSPITVSPFAPEGGAACPITTTALLSSIAPPAFSAVTPSPDKSNANTSKLRNPSGGATPTLKQRQPSATDDGDEPEPYEPEDIFKPVIPLPAIVDVVTGEEDETILFEERAKLFRFADDSKEWKERGLGQAKLLHNTVTGNVRFIMRREQTFKICANHNIAPEMKIDPMKGNAKARIWGAVDFADEEKRTEKFCIKFKTEEQAQEFNVKFEMAKTMSKEVKDKSSPKKSIIETKTTSSKSLADFAAAQKSSSWECSQCLVRNEMAKIQCMSCESAKPGHEDEVKKLQEAAKPAPPVMTIGQGGGFKFSGPTQTATSTAPASGFMFGSTTTKPITTQTTTTPGTGFTFGNAGTKTTETDKSVTKFGGFSFTNDPVVQKEEAKDIAKSQVVTETKTTETAKPSPFSGFSFTPKVTDSKSGSTVESISTPVKSTDATDSKADLFGSKVTSGLSTFGNIATGSSDGIKSDPNFKGFAGAGSQLFGSQTKKENDKTEDDDEAEDDFVPVVDFKPVIPLPALIEVKTGEEGEKKLFCERVKLYRFVQETKEWKERGIGEFKILKNEETGKVRLLMRREQVHKICCNHSLTPDLEFSPLQSSDKAWTWSAPDFSEGEIINELFAVKFKNVEMATNWIDIVKDCQKELKENPATSPTKPAEPTLAVGGSSSQSVSLADFAKSQKASGWECEQCLVRNDTAKIQCMSCESAKPGHEEEVKKLKEAAAPAIPVMTMGEGGGFKFSSSGATAASSTATSGFVFGTPEKPKSEAKSGGGFQFGNTKSTSGFSFVPTPTGAVTPTKENSSKWSFGSPEKKEFAFSGVKPPSPRKHTNSVVSENEEDDGLYKDDDEGDDLYFAPVIPLPPQVEVKTGEEEEEVLYSHRAKLFRYIDAEWKERGVGDVKILKNKSTKKIRLLMRRDQVLKICLNHYATTNLVSTFKEKDTKSWTWAAQDFSDGELTSMTFALRFKSPDIAKDFKETLDVAVADCETDGATSQAKETSPATTCTSQNDNQKNKSPSTEKEVVVLFNVEDYTPPPHVEDEVEVSFHGQGLKLNTETDAAEVATKIGAAKTMHILTLSGNTVGIEAAKAIGKSLEGHTEFRRAHWKDMFTGRMKTEIPPALIHLSNGVMTAQARLVELDLSDNAFGPIGMEGIKTLLASPSCFSLKILKLNNTGCGVTGGKALAKTLLECYHKSKAIGHPLALEVFVLGRSRQENEGGKALAEVFKLMGSLKEVVMPQNGIYHDGLTALADAFSNNPNLRHLDMNDNTFTEKGARPMASALSKLKNLEYLNLGDCLLKSAGATLIARALKNNHPNLKELILDSNEIRTKGLMEIIEAIADKNHLEKFSVDVNQLGDDGVEKMKKRLTQLGKLDVLAELEENQDPDSDEEDPDLEDDPEYESTSKTDTPSSDAVSNASDAKSTFTFATPTSKNAASIFGGSPSTSIFGGNSSSQVNIFGGSPTTTFKPSGNLFGASPTKETIFGQASDVSSTVADSSTETGERKTSFLFGGAGGQLAAGAGAPSIFAAGISSTPGNSLFGTQQVPATAESASANLFGSGTSSNIFGSGSGATFSFSSLGSSTGEGTGIAKASEDFKFKGAGATVFGSKATPRKDGEESSGDEAVEDSHDPHFEPIVPLPELVTVTTGEEGQQVIFKHRAKVYRFDGDTKQWKERGVGDIKILKQSETHKYRVLLRRDQIHKIACNHLIQADIELKPLSNSETAWCWYAMDFSEDEENGKLEHLAVRFKTIDTAKEFKSKFVECQEDIKSRKNKDVSVVEDAPCVKVERAVLSPTKKTEEETTEEEEDVEDDEDYEGDEDYNDLETIMFQQQAFLSQKDDKSGDWVPLGDVDLRILYDDDVYGARIVAEGPSGTEEEDNTVCNHLIAMQTNLSDDLTWSALDFSIDPPNYRTFKAQFESDEATSEFRDMFAEGKDLAEQSEILEQPGGLEGDPQDFYYGVGGDDEGQDS